MMKQMNNRINRIVDARALNLECQKEIEEEYKRAAAKLEAPLSEEAAKQLYYDVASGGEWSKKIFSFETSNFRSAAAKSGGMATIWVTVFVNINGARSRIAIRAHDELHIGSIKPYTDEGVAELQSLVGSLYIVKKRPMAAASLQIFKYGEATVDEPETALFDIHHAGTAPSEYFMASAYLNAAFVATFRPMVELGSALCAKIAELRGSSKTAPLDEAVASVKARFARVEKNIISKDLKEQIVRLISKDEFATIFGDAKTCIVVPNTKLVELIQTHNKESMEKLPQPITRAPMKFAAGVQVYDESKSYVKDGRRGYELATFNGQPLNDENVHKFVTSRSKVNGIFTMDSICFSQMGVSIPVQINLLTIYPKVKQQAVTLDCLFGDMGATDAPPAAAADDASAAAAAAAEDSPIDMSSLLAQLG